MLVQSEVISDSSEKMRVSRSAVFELLLPFEFIESTGISAKEFKNNEDESNENRAIRVELC